MRPKRPIHVMIDQVSVTCEENEATIDHAEENAPTACLTIGHCTTAMPKCDAGNNEPSRDVAK